MNTVLIRTAPLCSSLHSDSYTQLKEEFNLCCWWILIGHAKTWPKLQSSMIRSFCTMCSTLQIQHLLHTCLPPWNCHIFTHILFFLDGSRGGGTHTKILQHLYALVCCRYRKCTQLWQVQLSQHTLYTHHNHNSICILETFAIAYK